ncbi:DNA/RNA nuclease SfsA [Gorillibacterium massiliense]|uniref:DNA/RNA nuclease SfsA n=1 Tax=Gorillibacterium massiliense TaxID=1280390 RepID=UPI0004B41352|nr:DNA/RNA nuclease SfsA [Gorillibacterium massiliense]
MHYSNVVPAIFIQRVNRFIARVWVDGVETTVHVRNTGRCKELLLPGVEVYLERSDNPARRTAYSLIAVRKGERLINIDSQAPNAAVYEAAAAGLLSPLGLPDVVRREVFFGASRFDLYAETAGRKAFIEVKGVTLEADGVVKFPDAPTARGARHVLEMIEAVNHGYEGYLLFLIQMEGVHYFTPNREMDPIFANALAAAHAAGVAILAYDAYVTPDELHLRVPVEVRL